MASSCPFDEIVDAKQGDQVQWFQLTLSKNRDFTRKIVEHAEGRGCKGFFISVDAPQVGRREKGTPHLYRTVEEEKAKVKASLMTLYKTDMRSKFNDIGPNVHQEGGAVDRSRGVARSM